VPQARAQLQRSDTGEFNSVSDKPREKWILLRILSTLVSCTRVVAYSRSSHNRPHPDVGYELHIVNNGREGVVVGAGIR
jgi:hypothetical protein